jgi:hypothetical protein
MIAFGPVRSGSSQFVGTHLAHSSTSAFRSALVIAALLGISLAALYSLKQCLLLSHLADVLALIAELVECQPGLAATGARTDEWRALRRGPVNKRVRAHLFPLLVLRSHGWWRRVFFLPNGERGV